MHVRNVLLGASTAKMGKSNRHTRARVCNRGLYYTQVDPAFPKREDPRRGFCGPK